MILNQNTNIVISFLKNRKAGGIGDRIVGIINVKLLAKLLNRPFYINWEREDISEYLKIKNNYCNNNKKIQFVYMDLTKKFVDKDKKKCLSEFLKNASLEELNSYFDSNKDCEFLNNVYFIHDLYNNPLFSNENFQKDVLKVCKELFINILIPTDFLKNKMSTISKDHCNIIGIQIRTGDKYIITNQDDFGGTNGEKAHNALYTYTKTNSDNIKNYLFTILTNIKKDIIKNNIDLNKTKIFLTSDYNDILQITKNVWNDDLILYNNETVQHLDRNPKYKDFSKTFVDLVLLTHCKYLYISPWSNFGKIALLSNNNTCYAKNIHNLKIINDIDIINNVKKST